MAPGRRKNGARGFALLAAATLVAGCTYFERVWEAQRPPAHHRVRAGETLKWIADGYGIEPGRLARANQLRDDRVAVGQRLLIPDGARIVHRVRPGETLAQTAARYRVRDSAIAHANRLGSSPSVRPNQRLVMPREATLPMPPPGSRYAVARPAPPRAPPPAAPTASEREPAPEADLATARGLLDHAVADYRSARFADAVQRARQTEQALARLPEVPDARKLAARAAFVEGSALVALGRNEPAKQAFARVHARDPDFEPPRGWLSPRIEEIYLSARSSD
jgi:LysM repeat protein